MATPALSTATSTPTSVGKRTIGFKILLTLIGIGLLTTLLTTAISYYFASVEFRRGALNQLESLRTVLKNNVETYFQNSRNDLASMAESQTVQNALTDLSAARRGLLKEMSANGAPVTDEAASLIRSSVKKYYDDVLIANLKRVRNADAGSAESYQHRDTEANLLQFIYCVSNPSAVGSKFLGSNVSDIQKYETTDPRLRDAFTATTYAKKHEIYHTILTAHRLRLGYYDIFICDLDGYVVYTNFKELDFQGNLKNGPERVTGLGQAYASALEAAPGTVCTTDMAPYPKSYDDPAIFISAPIMVNGAKAGVFIYQLPLDRINRVMTFDKLREDVRLGQTGEAYLIGPDSIMRTDSRFIETLPASQHRVTLSSDGQKTGLTTIGVLKVANGSTPTEGARLSMASQSGTDRYTSYRGQPVIGSFAKLSLPGLDWSILLEQGEEEALAPASALLIQLVVAGLAVIVVLVLLGILLTRNLTRPVVALNEAMTLVASGDETARARVLSNDEIGELATTFNTMVADRASVRERLDIETERLQSNIEDLLLVVADASDGKLSVRAKVTEGALGNIASALNIMLENVSSFIDQSRQASTRLTNASVEIATTSGDLTNGASLQAREITRTVSEVENLAGEAQTVADRSQAATDATEKTRAAADRGVQAVGEVRETMGQIREKVQVTAQKIKRLGERSMEISSIVKSIGDISAQTDMLAFNASVESERGGEGRGFNLVADRVRDLAERTKQATHEIERLVIGIQNETTETVVQMERMTQEVENGNSKVQTANDSLGNIVQASARAAELVASISQVAAAQDAHARSILAAMNTINEIAANSQLKIFGARRTSEQLAELSATLNSSLSVFDTGNA